MRVLIAGCGYVGQATADLLQRAAWEVEGWTASAESAAKISGRDYPVRAVDISDAKQVAAASKNFDAVIHCASTRGGNVDLYRRVYLDGARNLLEQIRSRIFLFVSSTSVYAQKDGEWVTEESPAEPERDTGKVLRETEELVLARGGIVARLAGIYGPGRSALLRKFLSGQARIAVPERFINQAHRDDIAAALSTLVNRKIESQARVANSPEIYNVADNEPMLERECYTWLAAHFARAIPASETAPARKRGESNKRVCNAKLRALGWAPRFPSFARGMLESVLPNYEKLGA